jgi:hypothetical protein
MKNGPWRRLWIKYGVDPRSNKEYAKYQVVECRIPIELQSQFDTHKNNPQKPYRLHKLNSIDDFMQRTSKVNEFDFIFHGIPDKLQNHYQLCDIALKQVQDVIQHKEEYLSDICGYYSREAFNIIRKMMKTKVECWINGTINLDFDKDLIQDVQRNYRKENLDPTEVGDDILDGDDGNDEEEEEEEEEEEVDPMDEE